MRSVAAPFMVVWPVLPASLASLAAGVRYILESVNPGSSTPFSVSSEGLTATSGGPASSAVVPATGDAAILPRTPTA